jgi:hypothetical protein
MTTELDISPTKLAATLGAGLLALVVVLSLLAPSEYSIDLERLKDLVADGKVASIQVSNVSIAARLTEPVVLEIGGQRHRTQSVIVSGDIGSDEKLTIEQWEATGLSVVSVGSPPDHGLQEGLWVGFVTLLLLFGLYHLVTQAQKHRRDGSPRQHLDEARADLDAGRISAEEYERRASAISIEM